MFERFTDSARQVVVKGQDEARALKHNYLGTEHILLGLLVVPGTAQEVLGSLGVHVEETRLRVRSMVGEGDEAVTGQVPFTPRAKKVLESALREALSLGHNYIYPEHILLGLIKETEGVAARLVGVGTEVDAIRDLVVARLPRTPEGIDLSPRMGPRCKQALSLYAGLFVCQNEDGDGHTEHVEHGDGWTMRWTA